jgi:hypothetical protein
MTDPFLSLSTPALWNAYRFYRQAPRANRQARGLALAALRKLRGMRTVVVLN